MNGEAARSVAHQLEDATIQISIALGLGKREARIEARVLASHAWQVGPAWLIAHDTDQPTGAQLAAFHRLLSRRLTGEPVAYILGQREFFGLNFVVTPDVLIPRPETETLVEAALKRIPEEKPWRILDLGTGSGAIAISLARHRPLAEVVAVDASTAALAVAEANAQRLGVSSLRCLASNWYAELGVDKFDTIVANPPYVEADDPHLRRGDVRFEPASALAAGPAGLDDLGIIIAAAPAHLTAGGWLLVEHGWNQGAACRTLFEASNFSEIQTLRDLAGQERVTLGRHPR
jgi:release factor glutamine methyltransferase